MPAERFRAKTIRARLQLAVGLVVTAVVASVFLYVPEAQRRSELAAFDRELRATTDALAIAIGVALEGKSFEGMKLASAYVAEDENDASVVISLADGSVFAAYPETAGQLFQRNSDDVHGRRRHTAVCRRSPTGEATHFVTLSRSLASLEARVMTTRLSILAGCAGLLVFALSAVAWVAARHSRPIEQLSRASVEVSRGSLSTRVQPQGRDEVAILAGSFNTMVSQLDSLVSSVRNGMAGLRGVARELRGASAEMLEDVKRQSEATGTVASAALHVESTATEVDACADRLAASMAESVRDLSSLDGVARSASDKMRALIDALENASASTNDVASSVTQIAQAMGHLDDQAEQADTLLRELADATSTIDSMARGCADASTGVVEEADRGSIIVETTSRSIREIQSSFSRVEDAASRLDERVDAVGEALAIITQIADQTNLLSLNAAIIAAQAGEKGAGFAVVADQIKRMSDQTSRSANDVASLVNGIRDEAARTRAAIDRGGQAVDSGVTHCDETSASLDRIREKAALSTREIASIVASASAQSSGADGVSEVVRRVRVLASQTSIATAEQDSATLRLATQLSQIREMGVDVEGSASTQRERSAQLVDRISNVSLQIDEIVKSTTTQVEEVRNMATAIETFQQIARDGERRASDCSIMVGSLVDRSDHLQEALEQFKTVSTPVPVAELPVANEDAPA